MRGDKLTTDHCCGLAVCVCVCVVVFGGVITARLQRVAQTATLVPDKSQNMSFENQKCLPKMNSDSVKQSLRLLGGCDDTEVGGVLTLTKCR